MSIEIKKGDEISADEFPLCEEALQYVDLIMEVDDFGVSYFEEHVDAGGDYAVIRTDDYRELPEKARKDLLRQIAESHLDGTQSLDELAEFVDRLAVNTVESIVFDLAEIHERGLTQQEKDEIDALVNGVEEAFADGAAPQLDELMANANVSRMLDSGQRFLEQPPVDADMLEKIRDTRMPAYFVLDVSYSMNHERRIDYANEFVKRVSLHMRSQQMVDEVRCLIYWGSSEFIDLERPKRFQVGDSTDTGEALRIVGEEIRSRETREPVFLSLITDGLPNCDGVYQGQTLDPVSYTVKMASLLPDNVIFSQIAFAPLDPGDPDRPETMEDFQAYLTNLKRVTDAVKHGQTCVMVKASEHHLPWIPLGAYQKAKHLSLVDESFALLEDL